MFYKREFKSSSTYNHTPTFSFLPIFFFLLFFCFLVLILISSLYKIRWNHNEGEVKGYLRNYSVKGTMATIIIPLRRVSSTRRRATQTLPLLSIWTIMKVRLRGTVLESLIWTLTILLHMRSLDPNSHNESVLYNIFY